MGCSNRQGLGGRYKGDGGGLRRGGVRFSRKEENNPFREVTECNLTLQKRDYVSMGQDSGGRVGGCSGVAVREVTVIHNSRKWPFRSVETISLSIMEKKVPSRARTIGGDHTASRKVAVSGEEACSRIVGNKAKIYPTKAARKW